MVLRSSRPTRRSLAPTAKRPTPNARTCSLSSSTSVPYPSAPTASWCSSGSLLRCGLLGARRLCGRDQTVRLLRLRSTTELEDEDDDEDDLVISPSARRRLMTCPTLR